ncbi:MAG TPA: zinc ribbon domain-containing protein, partial [Gaiellaceae bacterium]|nr:zinc ribbon domain-containing protein [Gaiellaceae bacterium]
RRRYGRWSRGQKPPVSLPETPSTSTCRNCGNPLPPEARFCPECGGRVAAPTVQEVPPPETGEVPIKRFGTPPAHALVWLAGGLLALGVLLLALGSWVAGIVLLVVAAAVAALYASRVHRAQTSRALTRVRARSRAVVETVAAQAQAQREQLAVRTELQRLVGERGERLRTLGEAVYREDAEGTEQALAAVRELDEAIAAKEAEMTQIAERTQERVGRARLEAQPTVLLEPQPAPPEPYPEPVPEPYPPPDEGTPPTPEPVPEPYPPPDEGDLPRP